MSIILSQFRSTLDRSKSKGHVLRGALAAFTVRALGIVVAYLVQVLLACWTGSTQYGLYVYAWTWLTVLAMVVPIGLNEAILRFVPTYVADEKWDELRGIVGRCPLLIAIIGALTAAVGSLIVGLVPDLADSAFAPPLIIALWTTPFMAVLVFLEGMGRALGSVTMAYAPRNVGMPLLVLLASGIWILVDPALTARRVVAVLLSSSVFFVVLQSFMGGALRRVGEDTLHQIRLHVLAEGPHPPKADDGNAADDGAVNAGELRHPIRVLKNGCISQE